MADYMDLNSVEEIHRIYSDINEQKALVAKLPGLRAQYEDLVNELYEISPADSRTGEEISNQALEVGKELAAAIHASSRIQQLEEELMRYGIQQPAEQAA
ncbi:MAG: hypothetical protein GXY34_05165 [Syntrophomonadaceae bacterium]|nr:hypothetical protein [Syntrophomonadaceae bacterium]